MVERELLRTTYDAEHNHVFLNGDKRTTYDHGHDHEIEYTDGEPIIQAAGEGGMAHVHEVVDNAS